MISRIPISEIPTDVEQCNNWVHELYRKKDETFEYFARHGTFEGNGLPRVEVPRNYYDLIIELSWITILGIPSVIYLLKFLYTSSIVAQIIFIFIIFIGNLNRFCFCF